MLMKGYHYLITKKRTGWLIIICINRAPQYWTPDSSIMVLNDNQKIGIGLISLGLVFIFLGILFLIDAALIAIGRSYLLK